MGSRNALCHFNVITDVACSFDKRRIRHEGAYTACGNPASETCVILDSYCVVVCSSSLCSPWPHIEADWLNRCPLVFPRVS